MDRADSWTARPRDSFVFWLLVVTLVTAPLSIPFLYQTSGAMIELHHDFPGFGFDRFIPFFDLGSPDAAMVFGFRFRMYDRSAPDLKIIGIYYTAGLVADSGAQETAFRNTIFNRKRFDDAQLADFAQEWVKHFPGQRIAFGAGVASSRTAAKDLQGDFLRAVSQRMDPNDVYEFLTDVSGASDSLWFYFDRKNGRWVSLGSNDSLIRAYGLKP